MKKFVLALALCVLYTQNSQACGPLANLAGRVQHRVQQFRTNVRTTMHRVVDAPSKIVEAKPVRSVVRNTMFPAPKSSCPGGVCPPMK